MRSHLCVDLDSRSVRVTAVGDVHHCCDASFIVDSADDPVRAAAWSNGHHAAQLGLEGAVTAARRWRNLAP
jgi:hypothetical protein